MPMANCVQPGLLIVAVRISLKVDSNAAALPPVAQSAAAPGLKNAQRPGSSAQSAELFYNDRSLPTDGPGDEDRRPNYNAQAHWKAGFVTRCGNGQWRPRHGRSPKERSPGSFPFPDPPASFSAPFRRGESLNRILFFQKKHNRVQSLYPDHPDEALG